jgi:hypothetical protein
VSQPELDEDSISVRRDIQHEVLKLKQGKGDSQVGKPQDEKGRKPEQNY